MNDKKYCTQCSLVFCMHNKRYSEEYRKEMRMKCFIEILGASRPIHCDTCVISKSWLPIEKYEEAMRFFQITEKNSSCFRMKASCFILWTKRYEPPEKVRELKLLPSDKSTYNTLSISIIKLKPVMLGEEKEIYSSQDTLFERVNKVAHYGERAARFLLEFQDELPEEWKKEKYRLLFPGTRRTDIGGKVYIPALLVGDEKWFLHFLLANGYYSKSDFFVSI